MRDLGQRRTRGFLMVDHNEVIDVSTDVFREALAAQGMRGREPSLEKISYESATPDGILEDATLYYTVEFSSPPSYPTNYASIGMPTGRRSRVTVPIQLRGGEFLTPKYFVTAAGTKYSLSLYGLQEFFDIHARPLIRKRAPRATISWAPEGDYRAF